MSDAVVYTIPAALKGVTVGRGSKRSGWLHTCLQRAPTHNVKSQHYTRYSSDMHCVCKLFTNNCSNKIVGYRLPDTPCVAASVC